MITRFSLFIILLSLFYYYCKKDSGNQFRKSSDINLMEVPAEISPTLNYDDLEDNALISDSTIQFISAKYEYVPNN